MIQRETWDNSPELRSAVKDRLCSWGWHYFGGLPNLSYPVQVNFLPRQGGGPAKPSAALIYGPDDADEVEYVLTSCARASLQAMRNAVLLRVEHVTAHLPQEVKAKRLRMSRTTYQRRRDDAEYWAAVVLDEFRAAAQARRKAGSHG